MGASQHRTPLTQGTRSAGWWQVSVFYPYLPMYDGEPSWVGLSPHWLVASPTLWVKSVVTDSDPTSRGRASEDRLSSCRPEHPSVPTSPSPGKGPRRPAPG